MNTYGLFVIFLIVCVVIMVLEHFGGADCRAKGGVYFLQGDCVRIIMEPVP